MLLEFSVKNCLSFRDKVTFTAVPTADSSLPHNIGTKGDFEALKTVAIYGANASGKSNLFKALYMLGSVVTLSNNRMPDEPLPIMPFRLDDEHSQLPSEFEIVFVAENDIKYQYNLVATQNKIIAESLKYWPNGRMAEIFNREDVDKYHFGSDVKSELKDFATKTTSNKSFLATATNWNAQSTKPVFDYFERNLFILTDISENVYPVSMRKYLQNDDDLREFAIEFLRQTDFNISDFKVIKEEMPQEKMPGEGNKKYVRFLIYIKHLIDGKEYEFFLGNESLGTQTIFVLLPLFKEALDEGRALVMDELDKSLHPMLVQQIVELFNSEYNKHGAQLLFNTHDTNLLNLELLRRDQIWFTEKNNDNGASDLYSLVDYSPRKDEKIGRGYLAGRYGALPFMNTDFERLFRGSTDG